MKADLLDHRKFLRLARLLAEPKAHVLGYLMLMWRRGYQTGNPMLGDELDVESAAEFTGEPGKFATAAHSSGFIDLSDDGTYTIHDLFDHAPEWAKKRMARNGFLPSGVKAYSGITAKPRRAADETPKQTPRGVESGTSTEKRSVKARGQRTDKKENSENLADATASRGAIADASVAVVKPTPKPRDHLFDAIVTISGADPKVNGSHLGRVRKLLASSEPPYSPDEILTMADPKFQRAEMGWVEGRRLTLGEIEKHCGRIRVYLAGQSTANVSNKMSTKLSKAEQLDFEMRKHMEDVFGRSPPQEFDMPLTLPECEIAGDF